jgi:protein TonB
MMPRNALLILGVVISHLLVLLWLLSVPLMGATPSVPGALMVNLLGDSAALSSRKKTDAVPLPKASSNAESYDSSAPNDPLILGDGEGIGHSEEGDARPVMHSPKPHYPLASRQLREQGLVIVKLCVNEKGIVDQAGVAKSSGFQGLDQSALKALAMWRFAPKKSSAISVSLQCFQTPVQFSLEG